MPWPGIDPNTARDFNNAKRPPRRDPLTLDLDGDGIETLAASSTNPILFDHDGDGIKNGTGWISADDGFLVLDRDGNGTIDNGTELFGDSTPNTGTDPLNPTGRLADGFAALKQEDSNADGKVDSLDQNWSKLRVWRDLNQDGLSQANELFALSQLGIGSLSVTKTANNQTLANGNQIADLGTYTKTDGSTGTMGEIGDMADVNLAEDTFYREFPDEIPLAEGVENLPEMAGSGKVRDLREAASQSETLRNLLAQFSQATTRQEQRALLDQMLDAWADTSGLVESLDERFKAKFGPEARAFYLGFGDEKTSNYYVRDDNGNVIYTSAAGGTSQPMIDAAAWNAVVAKWEQKLHILEAFNGRYFFNLDGSEPNAPGMSTGGGGGGDGGGAAAAPSISVSFTQEQIDFLNGAYDALTGSVYQSLTLQTRLKPLYDQIDLVIDESGIGLDFSRLEQTFNDRVAQDPVNGMADLIEFTLYTRGMLPGTGWNGYTLIEQYIRNLPVTPELEALYTEFGVNVFGQPDVPSNGTAANDVILASGANESINGNGGDDVIFAKGGNDNVQGGLGDDVLDGGAGNDVLYGGDGADTYLFSKGSGQDTIYNHDNDAPGSNADTLLLGADIAPSDVTLTRTGDHLHVTINGTDDRIEVQNYFLQDGASSFAVENIRFADGTTWDIATVKAKILGSTAGNDILIGFADSDIISGGDGNDQINGRAGDDVLEGGTGADNVQGGDGNDTIRGGTGADVLSGDAGDDLVQGNEHNDTLYGDAGNDTLDGGSGNDYLNGGHGADTYRFGRGSGQDTIYNYDYDALGTNADTLLLGADVAPSDVTLTRTGDHLHVTINGTDDRIEVSNYFSQDGVSSFAVENIRFADGTTWDIAMVKARILVPTTGNDNLIGFADSDIISGGDGNDQINGRAGDDVLEGGTGTDNVQGGDGNDTVRGGTGADALYGDNGNDLLQGNEHNDRLYGGNGNDILDGGSGNDYLEGSHGADTYLFGRGSGQDTIYNYDYDALGTNADTLMLGADIAPSDVTLTRISDHLYVTINGTDDRIDVQNYFSQDGASSFAVENIRFADGTTWDIAMVKARVLVPTADNDKLVGYASSDILNGGSGDDHLSGKNGNDTLDGGSGKDYLEGGNGADTYLFGRDSGHDTIYNYDSDARGTNADTLLFAADIAPSDVTLIRSGDHLIVSINGTNDKVEVDRYFYQDGASSYALEAIRFADGTAWDVAAVKSRLSSAPLPAGTTVTGGIDNDMLTGGIGNDTFYGRAGNDAIDGGGGQDWLHGEDGDDLLQGGAQNDALYGGNGADLLQGQDGDDNLDGGAGNDTLDGGAGNDSIHGGAGDDVLDGGSGNDTLNGSAGNDTYLFGRGSGKDTINGQDTTAGKLDMVQLGADLLPTDVALVREGDTLLLTIKGTSDNLRVANYFINDATAGYQVEQIRFADGTIWDVATVKSLVQAVTADNDNLYGYATDDTLAGLAGDDYLYGKAGNDTLDGGDGQDWLYGEDGDDLLKGGAQSDSLSGGNGADLLQGQDGDDNLYGDTGNDTLDGGAGNDTLHGGAGNDTYLFGRGSGKDTVNTYDGTTGKLDVVQLGADLLPTDVSLAREGDTLLLTIKGTSDSLRVTNHFQNDATAGYQVEQIRFADGTIWDGTTIKSLVQAATTDNDTLYGHATDDTLAGLAGDDNLYGKAGNDTLDGGAGEDRLNGEDGDDLLRGGAQNDTLYGGNGADVLLGQDGDDNLYGDAGNDVLDGGAGNDTLNGGAGNDTYLFGKGSHADTINNYDSSGTENDKVVIGAGVNADQIWLQRTGSDLQLMLIETNDKLTVKNWYSSAAYRTDSFQLADGKQLLASQVDALVSAMAAFAPPAAGQTTLPADYQSTLNPVIAANWK